MKIYKRGQGTYVRGIAVSSLALLLLYGVVDLHSWLDFSQSVKLRWLTAELVQVPGIGLPLTWRLVICAGVFSLGAWGLWRFMNLASWSDFMIDTEGELKRVHWPTRKEVSNSSMVVIITVIVLGVYILVVDTVLTFMARTVWQKL